MTERFRLLQVCNVGRVTGGTGACAWTVTRALPDWEHAVLFFSRPDAETNQAFSHTSIMFDRRLTSEHLAMLRPDLVLFHNTPPERLTAGLSLPASIYYCHSQRRPLDCRRVVCCSEYLRTSLPDSLSASVLYQAVPRAPRPKEDRTSRSLRSDLIVGRICTPGSKKWPEELVPFYRELSQRHAHVHWEFVGCPESLQTKLNEAVGGRAMFLPASFAARSRYWNWDVLLYHHPTLTESFGRTVAEAMRAGCIPIVDDRGGFREQVVAGTGFLCADREAFSSALFRLEDNGERFRRSRSCRAHADESYSLARFRSRLLETFQSALVRR